MNGALFTHLTFIGLECWLPLSSLINGLNAWRLASESIGEPVGDEEDDDKVKIKLFVYGQLHRKSLRAFESFFVSLRHWYALNVSIDSVHFFRAGKMCLSLLEISHHSRPWLLISFCGARVIYAAEEKLLAIENRLEFACRETSALQMAECLL